MKKIILILVLTFFYGGLFAQFAQPTYVKKPKTLQPGSWYMIGKWDSASAAYKDTIGFYLERDSIHLWFNKPVITHGDVSVKGLVNTDSSFYIKGFEILRYYNTCYSVSVGAGSLYKNTTGQYNTAIGDNSLSNNIDAMYNTAVGDGALRDNNKSGGINGWGNTAIGDKALMANTTGGGNIALGAYAGMNENLSDRLWIGVGDYNNAIIYGNMVTDSLRLNASVVIKNTLISGGLINRDTVVTIADSTSPFAFPTSSTGWAEIYIDSLGYIVSFANAYWGIDGTVTLINNGTNVVTTNTDDKHCIFDEGSYCALINRRASSYKYMIKYHYHN